MSDLWTEAVLDVDAEAITRHVTAAKVAIADTMPFLLGATSPEDFENRKAMVVEKIGEAAGRVVAGRSRYESGDDASVLVKVCNGLIASIDEDFKRVAMTRAEEMWRAAQAQQAEADAAAREREFRARVEATLQTKASDFEDWLFKFRVALEDEGVDPTDFPADVTRDYFDAGMTPDAAANEAAGVRSMFGSKTATFPPGKDEQPHGTGTEVEHRPDHADHAEHAEHEQGTDGPGRKVELDPASGEYVGSEWEDSADGSALVQSASTYGNNPRFKTEEEANAWVAEGTSHEDAHKPETKPVEQPKSDDPFPKKSEGKQSAPFAREAAVPEKVATKTAVADTCPDCGGTGSVPSGGGPSEGEVDEGYVKCSTCGGTGKVAQDEKTARKTAWRDGGSGNAAWWCPECLYEFSNGDTPEDKAPTCPKCGTMGLNNVDPERTAKVAATGDEAPKGDYARGVERGKRDRANGDDPGVMQVSDQKTDYVQGYWDGYGGRESSLRTTAMEASDVTLRKIRNPNMVIAGQAPGWGEVTEAWEILTGGSTSGLWVVRARQGTTIIDYEGKMHTSWYAGFKPEDVARLYLVDGYAAQMDKQYGYTSSLQTTSSWVDAARAVVEGKQAQTVDGMLLDLYSASTMLGVYDALNPDNKAKFEAMPLAQAQSMAFRLVEKTSAASAARGDAVPFVGEAAGEGVREAFTRNDYGFPQDAAPRPPKPSSPTAGDMPGSVTYTSDPAQRPDYYGLGVPADQRKDRTPKDTAPVDGTRTARDKRADELARMTERSNELAERHRQERDDDRESRERHRQYWNEHPDEYDSYLKDNPYVASLVDGVVQVLAEANPYSTSGNPYVPAQVPPGTPDDILDGPVNPAPQMLDVPMTTRPRQMPSGDSTLPPAEPGAGSKETL